MAEATTTTTKRKPPEKAPATHQRSITDRTTDVLDKTQELSVGVIDKAHELSDEVLKSIEAGERAAIEALRNFVETVDGALPHLGDGPSRRQQILDSALEMAQQLVHTQYEFVRKVIDSTAKTLTRQDGAKAKGSTKANGSTKASGTN